MTQATHESVGGRTIAEIPKSIGYRSGRAVGEADGQRCYANAWAATEARGRKQCSGASEGIGAVATVTAKRDDIAEGTLTERAKANDQVGRTKPGQVIG